MKKLRLLALAGLFLISGGHAATITENFSSNPLSRGWQVFGNTNLFHWNAANQNLEVTWDSTQPNSYFHQPLGTTVTRHDDFTIAFDLRLQDIASGVEPGKTGPLQIGFGFLNLAAATSTNFMRGSYGSAPNVAGFDYYTSGYYDDSGTIYDSPAATVPSFISAVNSFDYAPQIISVYNNELPTNQTVHIVLAYTASNQTAVITVTTNGVPLRPLTPLDLTGANGFATAADNFLVDTFSISSFSSAGDDYDSVLAHGTVANLSVSVPPPAQNLALAYTNTNCQVKFSARTNWLFTLERTTDWQSWSGVSPTVSGLAGNLTLSDTNPPADHAGYRIRAVRP
jgi:hypothetical protein